MPALPTHSKIITAVAKQTLMPKGVRQSERSRVWYDDRGWYATVIEFQPSSRSRGTYLNAGVRWLWDASDGWAFHLSFQTDRYAGSREHHFVEFRKEASFRAAVQGMAEIASKRVDEARDGLRTLSGAYEFARKRAWPGDGKDLDLATLEGLTGRKCRARVRLYRSCVWRPKNGGQEPRNERAQELLTALDTDGALRARLERDIQKTRAMHRLKALQGPLLPLE